MRKSIILLFSAFAVAGLMTSCNKTNSTGGNNQNNGNNQEETVTEEELITIDGAFDDWKALKEGSYSITELPDDEFQYTCLLKMMAVADRTNVYLYFEYQEEEEQTASPMTIVIDADDDPDTGFTDYHWSSAGWDYAIESSAGFIGSSYKKMNDFKLLKPMEGYDGQARSWNPKNYTDGTAKGVKNRGVKENDIYTFEINIPRTLIKAEKKGITIRVATYVENQEWHETGILPIEDGISASEMMEVYLP